MSPKTFDRRTIMRRVAASAVAIAAAGWSPRSLAQSTPRRTAIASDDVRRIAWGVRGPEGPTVLPDDSIAMVEFSAGNIVRCTRDGKIEVLAALGPGCCGTALGRDGALYCVKLNMANFMRSPRVGGPPPGGNATVAGREGGPPPTGAMPAGTPSVIARIDLKTRATRVLYTHLDGAELSSPNDLVIDRWGDIWYSDPADASIGYARTDGSLIRRAAGDMVGINGIALSPDKRSLYAMSNGKLLAYSLSGRGRLTESDGKPTARVLMSWPTELARGADGLKTEASGNILAACGGDGIARISPSGELLSLTQVPGLEVINIAFSPRENNALYLAAHPGDRLGGPVRIPWDAAGAF